MNAFAERFARRPAGRFTWRIGFMGQHCPGHFACAKKWIENSWVMPEVRGGGQASTCTLEPSPLRRAEALLFADAVDAVCTAATLLTVRTLGSFTSTTTTHGIVTCAVRAI